MGEKKKRTDIPEQTNFFLMLLYLGAILPGGALLMTQAAFPPEQVDGRTEYL